MSFTPQVTYFIAPGQTPVTPTSDLWRQSLPMSRRLSVETVTCSPPYGEFFNALHTFFQNDGYEMVCRALTRHLQQKVNFQDLREIHICLMKHGEFYHPACIEVVAHHQRVFFVLNVAVSETGIGTIHREYQCLLKLNDEFPLSFLPEVFGLGEVVSPEGRKIRMFLGQWFDGYNEFHVSKDPSDNQNKILVWDESRNPHYLSLEQSAALYRQAAKILTYYYNVESSEQIFPWHHGAGDFVVKIDEGDLDVKLISARGYKPLFKNLSQPEYKGPDAELILQALLIFFLNLSVRMRLDRYDGVGDIVWADGPAVQGTLDGFLDGLALKPSVTSMPDSLDKCFRYYISVYTEKSLFDLGQAAVKTFNPHSPEYRTVMQHLGEHVAALSRAIERVSYG